MQDGGPRYWGKAHVLQNGNVSFHILKVDSLNESSYAWVKIVSQRTKQDGDLEDSYHTRFAKGVLCPRSREKKIE